MNRDTAVFTACGFALGLVIGSFLVGPHLAKAAAPAAAPAEQAPAAAAAPAAAPSMDQMNAVRQQIGTLKAAIERDPKNFDALVQLGDMYMDAAKFAEAIGYFERALEVRDEPSVRTDLGICYKNAGQPEKALAAFERAAAASPDQWQALFNEAVVLGDLKRFDDARAVAAKLKTMRPDDPQVQQLQTALAGK